MTSLANRTRSGAFVQTDETRLGRAIAPLAARHPDLSGVHALRDALDAFAARVLLARAADRSIDAQYYAWQGDLTGTLLFNELRSAADRGVRVRLLLDDNTTKGLDETLAALDVHPNIEVRLFNPFVIRKPRFLGYLVDFTRLNRRMHNKAFVVDNQAAIVGGRNIGDQYLGAGDGALFADLDVLAIGPVVHEVSADFDRYWASESAFPADRILPVLAKGRIQDIHAEAESTAASAEARDYVERVRALPIVGELVERRLPLDWAKVRMVSDDPAKVLGRAGPGELLVSRIEELLERPAERVGLVSGYFVPGKTGVERLAAMVRRGVHVNVLTNALEATDVPIVHAGYAPYRRSLLQAGIGLWETKGAVHRPPAHRDVAGSGSAGSGARGSGTALHAKTFTVDGERVFVGSFNFDPRSARLNTELGFVIESPELARRMDEAFARLIPERAYEVRLSASGKLIWIERRDGREIVHETEPGTTAWQRARTSLLSLLPIEWLL